MLEALAKVHASFIAAHSGETIEYRRHPGEAFVSASGEVHRQKMGDLGQPLTNTIRVYMSKGDLPDVTAKRDQIRLRQRRPGVTPEIYTVMEVESDGPGHWWLTAVRAS